MLQRLITASSESLIWGEAGGALDQMADAFQCYEQMLGPGGQRYKFGFGGNGAQQFQEFNVPDKQGFNKWIACMNPPVDIFFQSFYQFFESVYASPAEKLGFTSWGVKEVQSGLETARFLRKLYPSAKFVFLVRNPFACLTSIKRRNWMDRPQDPRALEYFGGHWARLAGEFRSADFGRLVKYEELVATPEVQDSLGNYLGCVELALHFNKLSRADWDSQNDNALSFWEKRRLSRIVRVEMMHYGYDL